MFETAYKKLSQKIGLISSLTFGVLFTGTDELSEQRMWVDGAGTKLRMKLSRDKPRMVGKLDNLDQCIIRRDAAEEHAVLGEFLTEFIVHFIPVAMALIN